MSKKSRKLIRSTQVAAEPEEASEALPTLAAQPAREFFFLPDVAPEPVDEKDLHNLMKVWRHGRATRTIWQALQDGYVTVFSVVMLGAMVINVILKAQQGMATCDTETCQTARLLMPTATVLACFALTLGVARLFGPVLASAAEGFWLMDAPISRRRLLRGRLVLAIVAAGVLSALLSALVAALSGMSVLQVVLWTAGAALGSAALMAFAAAEQGRERTRRVRAIETVFAAAALVTVTCVVAIAAGWLPAGLAGMSGPGLIAMAVVAVLAVVGLIAFAMVALARLEQIRRARLLSGGSLVSGMQGAMFALDFGLVRDILVERQAIARGHVRPAKGRGLGLEALIWRDVERLKRFPKPFIGLAVSLFVPYAADALGVSQLNPLVSGLCLVVALVPFLGSLRVLTRTGGLARALPFKTTQIRTAAMAVPAALTVVWVVAASPAFIGIASHGADRTVLAAAEAATVTGMAGLLGAVRWVTAKKVDFAVPMMATESGAMPPTLLFNLFRGLDMVALITAPLILGAPAYWSFGLALTVFVALRGTFNMDELKAEQESAQREMAAAKAARAEKSAAAEKIKVTRPGR